MSLFAPAVKAQMKARVALCGPTGSGKTWTALEWATVLGGRTALIDTERGSAALYAPHFAFDTLRIDPPYEPERLVKALEAAADEGYDVVIVDSFSHFWEGEGGVLDVVDGAGQRAGGNKFVGWKVGTPLQRHLVDTILGLNTHVIVTMRSKMDYVLEENDKGKMVPRKVGMAPVQRAGVEYEFTLVGDLDLEHRIIISKSRCDVLADQVVQPGRAKEAAQTFSAWLDDGEAPPNLASKDAHEVLSARLDALDTGARTEFGTWKDGQGFVWHPGYTVADLDTVSHKLDEIAGTGDDADSSTPGAGTDGEGGGSSRQEVAASSSPLPASDEEERQASEPCSRCGNKRRRRVRVGGKVRCSDEKACDHQIEEDTRPM